MTSVFARVVVLGLLAFASSTRVTPQQQEPMSPPLLQIQTSSSPPDWIFNSNPNPLPLPPNAAEPRLGVSAGSQEKVCISAGHPPRPASACPTAAEQGGLYLVRDGISDPRPTSTPAPMYSIDTRTKKPQGTLVLWMVVAQNGRPMDVRVAVSLEKGLDRDAANAARHWKFTPALKDGKPMKVQLKIAITFATTATAEDRDCGVSLGTSQLSQRLSGLSPYHVKCVYP